MYIYIYKCTHIGIGREQHLNYCGGYLLLMTLHMRSRAVLCCCDDDDVYLEYYNGKGFHINYSCLHVLRETKKLKQQGISNERLI
jgi:hypothetical protein